MSVHLEVKHVTTYRYARPVEFSPHRVMFRPRAAHDLRVLSARLDVVPQSRQHWIHDVFSNSVAVVEPTLPAAELKLSAQFTIEHFGVQNLELPIEAVAEFYPFEYSPYSAEDQIDLANFLPLQYPGDAGQVSDWLARLLPRQGRAPTREVLANIGETIRGDFRYIARDAMGTQPPAQTLALHTGTCRDFALLMIEAARGLGLAARFVSGYLYDATLDQPGKPVGREGGSQQGIRQVETRDDDDVRGAGATHAWLQVFLPGAGWVPYDPTNTLYGGTDLIRVAYPRTPEQAMPISGSWFGAANNYLGMNVQVQVRRVAGIPEDAPCIAIGEP